LGQAVSLRDRFVNEWTALDGKVVICKSGELNERIYDLLKTLEIDAIAAWEEKQLPTGLIGFLKTKGMRVLEKPEPQTRVGLTGTLAAIADTGTLIIPGGPGRPLTVSLLPEIHIAVLNERDIHENLVEVLKLPGVQQASAVVLVSGPSRTADIEMTLTIGAHGPAEVHVFCCKE
jgi:L-lactate dehydrogenase complex protein LldG